MIGRRGARCATALLALLLPLTCARAQDAASTPEPDHTVPLSAEEQAALREALNFDAPLAITVTPAARGARTPSAPRLDWNRTEKSDGSAAVTVKRPLPTRWESSLGADFGVAAAPALTTGPERPLPNGDESSRGAAWASVKVPGLASIDARLGANDASRLGTTFSRSLPVGDNSVTLQNSYAVTETLAAMPATSAAPAPAAAAPVWSTERMVKFNILSTGTSFGAGTTSSSTDNATHNKISAEQKLFDRLNVTTSVTDVGAANSNKSITAGFKLSW
jgi:hypothetical protein